MLGLRFAWGAVGRNDIFWNGLNGKEKNVACEDESTQCI